MTSVRSSLILVIFGVSLFVLSSDAEPSGGINPPLPPRNTKREEIVDKRVGKDKIPRIKVDTATQEPSWVEKIIVIIGGNILGKR